MPARSLGWMTLAVIALVAACTGEDRALMATAEAFTAPPSWTQLSRDSSTEPVCFSSSCDTIVLRWSTSVRPTADVLREAAASAGWTGVTVDSCTPRENVTGPVPFCRLAARGDDADVALHVSGPVADPDPWEITLRVS